MTEAALPTGEPTAATAWVVVPCQETPSVLALAATAPMLPAVTFEGHRVPTDTSVATALRATPGIETNLVRLLDIVGTFGPDVVVLVEPIASKAAPAGTQWIGRGRAADLACHGAAVERWFAEEERGAPPAMRVPWYRPGWSGATERWVDDALARLGHTRTGRLRPISHTPYSSVSQLSSSLGELFLKAARPGEEHTAPAAALLSARVPGKVPGVVAVDAARGWWLSPAVHEVPARAGAPSMHRALEVLAEVQVASLGWVPDLAGLGCPDQSLEVLARGGAAVIGDDAVMAALEPHERAALADAAALVPAWCEAAASTGIPACVQHGDFGMHNVLAAADGPVLIDWRAWIGHPFADPHLLLQNVNDQARQQAAWDAYLGPWAAGFARAELDEAVGAMLPVFNAQYLVQVGRLAIAVAREPEAYEVWASRQLSHNLRWFARRLLRA